MALNRDEECWETAGNGCDAIVVGFFDAFEETGIEDCGDCKGTKKKIPVFAKAVLLYFSLVNVP